MSAARIARLRAVLVAALVLSGPTARAEEVYKYVDDRGVVHLSNVPNDRRFAKYQVGSAGGSGRGIFIIARRERRRPSIGPVYLPGALRLLPDTPEGFDLLIRRAARRNGIPPAMVKAVVKAESNFQPFAVSHKGAQGLMQLMPATAEDLGVEDPFRAEENILGGSRYLRAMYDRFGDWEHALAAYNAGPGAVEKHGGIPPYAETQQYVERVLHYYRRYDGDFSR